MKIESERDVRLPALHEPRVARNHKHIAARRLELRQISRRDARHLHRNMKGPCARHRDIVKVVDVVARAREQLHGLPPPIDEGVEDIAEKIDAREGETHRSSFLKAFLSRPMDGLERT